MQRSRALSRTDISLICVVRILVHPPPEMKHTEGGNDEEEEERREEQDAKNPYIAVSGVRGLTMSTWTRPNSLNSANSGMWAACVRCQKERVNGPSRIYAPHLRFDWSELTPAAHAPEFVGLGELELVNPSPLTATDIGILLLFPLPVTLRRVALRRTAL